MIPRLFALVLLCTSSSYANPVLRRAVTVLENGQIFNPNQVSARQAPAQPQGMPQQLPPQGFPQGMPQQGFPPQGAAPPSQVMNQGMPPEEVQRGLSDQLPQDPSQTFPPGVPNPQQLPAPGNLSTVFDQYPLQPTVEVCDEQNAPGRWQIYCSGKLLQAVNQLSIYNDSKTFVDMPIKPQYTAQQVNDAFLQQFPQPINNISKTELLDFINQHFNPEGHELDTCTLPDWNPSPQSFNTIADDKLRNFALSLNNIWKDLCRKVKSDVNTNQDKYSLLYVPNNFIIPGGRFREFYYWDAYWIVKGLLASGMYETTRGMIDNFAHIIDTVGFIPNGGRVYYLRRSQPPLLTAMAYEYYQATRNTSFVKDILPVIEKEMLWWMTNRTIDVAMNGQNHTLYQYRTPANVPRPESFREDMTQGETIPNIGRRQQFYKDIGSAAESGWDFSSRWLADKINLPSIHTTDIVPVDLNAYMCYNFKIMAFLNGEIGNVNRKRLYTNEYLNFRDSFTQVFYVPEQKGWYDFDYKNRSHNFDFYPSIAVPLFTECYDELSLSQSNDLFDKMADLHAFDFVGGVPTSLINNQEQWDYPNGWSPLNHMIIEGLRKSDNPRMQQKAFMLAQKWIRGNLASYDAQHVMYEKFNVNNVTAAGGAGGEYLVQAGFGWSNGVVLDLLQTYGDRLTADTVSNPAPTPVATAPVVVATRDAPFGAATGSGSHFASAITFLGAIAVYHLF